MLLKLLFTNGFILLIPILLWNVFLAGKLPPAYQPAIFDKNIPSFIALGETILRAIVMLSPLMFRFSIASKNNQVGLGIYVIGTLLYFVSWLLLIYIPESGWSKSLIGFSAPAYLPLVWLAGMGLMFEASYFKLAYSPWHYWIPIGMFVSVHCSHAVLVWSRL